MVSRFYFESSGTPGISPAFHSAWDVTSGALEAPLSKDTGAGSAMASFGSPSAPVNTDRAARGMFVYGPLAAQTISSGWEFQMRADRSFTHGNPGFVLHARVIAPDESTVRGTLINMLSDGVDWSTSFQNRRMTGTFTSVDAQDGDFLVLEVGLYKDSGASTDTGNVIRVGSAAASDLPEDDTATTDLNPWFETANDITASAGGGATTRRYSLPLTGVG